MLGRVHDACELRVNALEFRLEPYSTTERALVYAVLRLSATEEFNKTALAEDVAAERRWLDFDADGTMLGLVVLFRANLQAVAVKIVECERWRRHLVQVSPEVAQVSFQDNGGYKVRWLSV